jgi:hypothetical protein
MEKTIEGSVSMEIEKGTVQMEPNYTGSLLIDCEVRDRNKAARSSTEHGQQRLGNQRWRAAGTRTRAPFPFASISLPNWLPAGWFSVHDQLRPYISSFLIVIA